MANTIKLAHNATSGKTPTDLAAGEVAINSANKKIWVGTNGTTAGQVLVFDHSLYSTDLSDNDTTYSAGSGLSLSGTTFSHSDTSSQSSSNNSGRTYIQDITLDTYGHVTGLATATETVTNTDTNTTYSAGSGLTLSSTTFSHSDTSSQSSVNNSGRTYIQDVTLDTYGHVTGLSSATETVTNTNTTYSAGSGLSLSGTTFSHTDTSSQGSVNNSGRTYIQDVTLDTYGHVTGLASATETVTNTDTNTTYSAGNGLSLSGTTFSLGAAWANMPAGIRTNYTLGIQAPNSGYAGFYFQGDGNASNANAGYLLVRGASGSDVYTTQGITLVADLGWLTLAQRTTSGKGVRIMSGTSTSTERLKITTAGDIQFVNGNSFTYNGNNVATQAWVSSQGFLTSETGDIQGVTAGAGLSGGGTSGTPTLSHADTSSQGSINNSGRTYIQDVTLDTYGHVTGLASATETVTNTNTTYSAGSGISLSGTTFSHSDTSSQSSVNGSGRTYIQDITLDTYGHVTGLGTATETVTNTDTNTTYSAGSGLSLSSTTFSHSDTSSQSSVNNSGRTYIQDVTLDTYGHVTGLASATETVTNTDTNTTYTAGTGLTLSGTQFSLTNNTQYLKKLSAGSAANLDTYTDNGFRSISHTGHSKLLLSMNAGGSTGTFQLENHYNGECRVRNKVDSSTWSDWEYLVSTTTGQTAISGTILHTGNLTAGGGLTRSGTTISHSDTSSQGSVNNSGRTYIQDVTLDTYGHVTGLSSATETVTNTDTNTTYSAGSGISLSSTTFSHSDTSSQSSVNNSGRTYIQDVTLDTYGHVTGLSSATETVTNTDTNTTYSAGGGLSLSSTTFSHSDTSSQSSVNNSGRTYIQDVTLDTYGHVTGLASATETVTNTDTNTTYSAGSGLSLSSTTFSHSDTSSQASVNNSGRTYIQDVTLDTYGHVTGLASATESAATLSEVDDAIEAYGGGIAGLTSAGCFGGAASGVTNQGLSRDVAYKIMNNSNSSVACVTTTGGSSDYYLRYKNGGNFSWERIEWNQIQGMSALTALP